MSLMGPHNFMVTALGPRVQKNVPLSYLEKSTKHRFNIFISDFIHLAQEFTLPPMHDLPSQVR